MSPHQVWASCSILYVPLLCSTSQLQLPCGLLCPGVSYEPENSMKARSPPLVFLYEYWMMEGGKGKGRKIKIRPNRHANVGASFLGIVTNRKWPAGLVHFLSQLPNALLVQAKSDITVFHLWLPWELWERTWMHTSENPNIVRLVAQVGLCQICSHPSRPILEIQLSLCWNPSLSCVSLSMYRNALLAEGPQSV